MSRAPDGFELHSGLDGLVVGLAIVFIVKVETVIARYIDWTSVMVVGDAIRRTKLTLSSASAFVGGVGDALAGHITLGLFGGWSGGPVLTLGGGIGRILASGFVDLVNLWVPLVGAGSATFFERTLLVLGVWIAILSPLWYWVIQPGMFWWRERDTA